MQLQERPQACRTSREIADLIRQHLRPNFPAFSKYSSTLELEASNDFLRLRDQLRHALNTPHVGSFADARGRAKQRYRILAWNIERGKQLKGQLFEFRHHPYLKECDVLLLTETDLGMARSGNVDVAQTLARELGFHYAFAPCYLSLVKGSGIERDIDGENDLGLHGNAILSRYPIRNVRHISLKNGIDKMAGNEKRIGCQAAVLADIDFPEASLPVACVHLDANSKQRHRAAQMRTVLNTLPLGPALIGGDWNTTTFDSSSAFHAIMGYCRRVLMGPGNVIRNHYLHPYRWFEKELFASLERAGFDYRSANHIGEYTIFYDVADIAAHKGLAEWVPGWCFPFIRWALREHNGGCPLKIDWFASRDLRCENPRVLHDLREKRTTPLSDHDAIGVEILLA